MFKSATKQLRFRAYVWWRNRGVFTAWYFFSPF